MTEVLDYGQLAQKYVAAKSALADAQNLAAEIALGVTHSPWCEEGTPCVRCRLEAAEAALRSAKRQEDYDADAISMFCAQRNRAEEALHAAQAEVERLKAAELSVLCQAREAEARVRELEAQRDALAEALRSIRAMLPRMVPLQSVISVKVLDDICAEALAALKGGPDGQR